MDRAVKNIQRYSDSLPINAFNEDGDIPHIALVRRLMGEYSRRMASIQLTNTADSSVNGSTSGTALNCLDTSNPISSLPCYFNVEPDGVRVPEAGIYEVSASFYLSSAAANTAVGFSFTVQGGASSRQFASSLITAANGNEEAVLQASELLELEAGDKVGGEFYQLAQAGTVDIAAGKSAFQVRKMPSVEVPKVSALSPSPSIGKAKIYDGVDDEDRVKGAASLIDHKDSWSLLLNAEFNTFADFQYLVGNYEIGFTSSVWNRIYIQETIDAFRWQIADGNGNFNIKTWIYDPALLTGKRVLILTNSGSTDLSGTDLHISNNVLTGGVSQSVSFNDTAPIHSDDMVIGKQRGGAIPYKGAIKQLEILNRLPTQQEIDNALAYGSWRAPGNAIGDTDLSLDIDFDKEDGQIPTTRICTPIYKLDNLGGALYTDF